GDRGLGRAVHPDRAGLGRGADGGRPPAAEEPGPRRQGPAADVQLLELACTQHREIDNRPPPEVVATLRTTAARMEEVRRLLGDRTISVSSGYRCSTLNRAVGGAR